MPNLAFQYEVLKQVITERAAVGDPVAKKLSNNNFNNSEMQFAVLGALGPDVFRYMPISNQLATFLSQLVSSATSSTAITNGLAQLLTGTSTLPGAPSTPQAQQALAFELYFNPLGAIYSVLFSTLVVPDWPIFNNATDVLNQLDTIIQNQDNSGLLGMIGELQGLQSAQSSLAGLQSTLANLTALVGTIIGLSPWMESNNAPSTPPAPPLPPPADPIFDRRYEFLRWHHTGLFAQKLLENATTDPQQAYAFGWLCHVASSVTGEPFVNNIVGGPYRTHWWRNRLVGNFVDSWTFGFFEQNPLPTMGGPTGDNPSPAYFDPQTGAGWPSICSANLQNQFNVANLAGPSTADGVPDAVTKMAEGNIDLLLNSVRPFTDDISKLLTDTISQTYTVSLGSALFPGFTTPIVGLDASGKPIPAFLPDTFPDTFARAYIGAFAVYWFMTSGSGPIGNNALLALSSYYPAVANLPGFYQTPEPAWIKSGSTPSLSQAGVDVGGGICSFILAVLGIWVFTNNDGQSVFHAGIFNLTDLPGAVDWPVVANNAYWLKKTVLDQENALRDALVWTALAYPPPVYLGVIDPNGNTLPVTDFTLQTSVLPPNPNPSPNVPTTKGVPLCKTYVGSIGDAQFPFPYPHQLDATMLGVADLNFDFYPLVPAEQPLTDSLIPANLYPQSLITAKLNPGGMLASSTWPTRSQLFGGPVANAVQLLAAQAKGLQDYNLDADRGYGWRTWNPNTGSIPSTPPVVAVKEP